MNNENISTNILLLVEDNAADAERILGMLAEAEPGIYQVLRAETLKDATRILKKHSVTAVLLDLKLADASGLGVVETLKPLVGDAPIIIITRLEDEQLAVSCINSGAQDYLITNEIKPASLRRAIRFSLSRFCETKNRELSSALDQYRSLSSATTGTTITAALAGTGAVRERYPDVFTDLVRNYLELLALYLDQLVLRKNKPKDQMEAVITKLGDAGGGPRDLLDVHVAALDEAVGGRETERTKSLAVDGRLLALEMMGLMVDYYRVGNRRFIL